MAASMCICVTAAGLCVYLYKRMNLTMRQGVNRFIFHALLDLRVHCGFIVGYMCVFDRIVL